VGGVVEEENRRKIILFDIDGTILNAGKAPVYAILKAMEEVFGVNDLMPPRGEYSFAGKTDPEIVTDIMVRKNCPGEKIESGLKEVFERYIFYMKSLMADKNDAYLHPGALSLIQRLDARDDVVLGLLTGNIEEGAKIKLGYFGLDSYFSIGAYGSDSPDRDELPVILLERVNSTAAGNPFSGDDVVILGDSIHDIRCAKTVGATSAAVATGTTSIEELMAEKPDHIFRDLSQTDRVLETIAS
jgi:phosphoglycolate phosphatase-like HAD superfamily hydrolase